MSLWTIMHSCICGSSLHSNVAYCLLVLRSLRTAVESQGQSTCWSPCHFSCYFWQRFFGCYGYLPWLPWLPVPTLNNGCHGGCHVYTCCLCSFAIYPILAFMWHCCRSLLSVQKFIWYVHTMLAIVAYSVPPNNIYAVWCCSYAASSVYRINKSPCAICVCGGALLGALQ